MCGIDLRLEDQIRLNRDLQKFQPELALLPSYPEVQKKIVGSGYGEIEALLLYLMVRYWKPARMIEVGSGVSTCFSQLAGSKNRDEGRPLELICVEPFPYSGFRQIAPDVQLIQEEVQRVPLHFFEQLSDKDVLFIDSSHVLKMGSDVSYLYLEVLPRLHKGVLVHIHDIAYPYPAASAEQVTETLSFAQEQFVVQAFLSFNKAFHIIYCSSYLHFKHPDALKALFPNYLPARHFPSSLWLRRVGE